MHLAFVWFTPALLAWGFQQRRLTPARFQLLLLGIAFFDGVRGTLDFPPSALHPSHQPLVVGNEGLITIYESISAARVSRGI